MINGNVRREYLVIHGHERNTVMAMMTSGADEPIIKNSQIFIMVHSTFRKGIKAILSNCTLIHLSLIMAIYFWFATETLTGMLIKYATLISIPLITLTFTAKEMRTRALSVLIYSDRIIARGYFGVGSAHTIYFRELLDRSTTVRSGEYRDYEYMYLQTKQRRLVISEFYHANYAELKTFIGQHARNVNGKLRSQKSLDRKTFAR